MLFTNRYDAAIKLMKYLDKYRNEQGIILAVPRGGVHIGYFIAKHYHLPLELLMTKKIGHPQNREFAIGAVSLEDYFVNEQINVPESYIEREVPKIRKSLKERYELYMGDHTPPSVEGKVVIIVDDGVATGNTLLSAIRMIRRKKPKKIVVAVPVAPNEAAHKLRQEVDDFICLHTVHNFQGVGYYYVDFSEVSDQHVISLLKDLNRMGNAA